MKASKFSDAQRAFIMKRGAAGVVDTFSRYAPVIDPRFSYRAEDVVATREQACAVLGYPKTIRVDQGTEFGRWHHQPATVIKSRKLHPRALQHSGSEQWPWLGPTTVLPPPRPPLAAAAV